MSRRAAPGSLTARTIGLLLVAWLLVGCEFWPFGQPQPVPAPVQPVETLPPQPGGPDPTILIPPPID